MKKFLITCFIVLATLIAATMLVICSAFIFEPAGKIVFSIAGGCRYKKVGETVLNAEEKSQRLAIYQTDGKPFLLVGPCVFEEGETYEDFFFINRDQVIRTAIDKGGDTWCRLGNWLYMLDDLSDCERLRTSFWDDLKCSDNASVRDDASSDCRIYTFKINSAAVPVSLAIPAEFLPPAANMSAKKSLRSR